MNYFVQLVPVCYGGERVWGEATNNHRKASKKKKKNDIMRCQSALDLHNYRTNPTILCRLVSQTTARHTLVQSPQQNVCMGTYMVIDLEQFPVRISTDKAPTPLTKFGICSFFFFFCHSFFFSSFFFLFFFSVSPCQIHGVSVRFSWDDPCLHNNNK